MTKTIKSDERLLEILRTLKNRGELGVTELSNITGIPTSTVHTHLATLEEKKFAVKENRKYRISLKFLDFGKTIQRHNALYSIVTERADELADKTDEQIWCLVEEQHEVVYLYGARGDNAIQTDTRVGKREFLPELAGGRAILAHLPDRQREEIMGQYDFNGNHELPFDNGDALQQKLETIRDRGIAFNSESYVKGVNAVGAPIIDNTGRVYGALSICGPANRLKENVVETELTDLLLGVTNEIGVNLTYK